MKKLIYLASVMLIISIIYIFIEIITCPTPAKLTDHLKNYDFFGDHNKFATHLLYQVNDKITSLINFLNKKYNGTNNIRLKEGLLRINDRYHINRLIENVPNIFNSDTSYTVNKGEVIAICLRHKNNLNKFHDLNLITFVTIHELAHIFSIGYGHDEEFWENFKFLLNEAIINGIYDNEDYSKTPKYYCGMNVHYNPMYDNTITKII
jgi:hypothetical protein